jgi:hypothetical protein
LWGCARISERILQVAVVLFALHVAAPGAAQLIRDPENPSFGGGSDDSDEEESDDSDAGDGESGDGPVRIMDPENPAVQEESASGTSSDGGAVRIMDPENPSVDESEEADGDVAAEPGFRIEPSNPNAPLVIIRSELDSLAGVDFRRENLEEDVFLWRNTFDTRLRIERDDKWRIVIGGRLTWWMTASGADGRHPIAPDYETFEGRVEPELRELFFAHRFGKWSVRVGQQFADWGTSDFFAPADLVNPTDFRRGVFEMGGDSKIPIPMLDVSFHDGSNALQLLLIPFFIEHRVDVYGSDYAVLQPESGLFPQLNVTSAARRVVDRSVEADIQQPLTRTEKPDARPRNASLGARYTRYIKNGEISFAYLFDWDRFPVLDVNDSIATLLLGDGGFGGFTSGNIFEQIEAITSFIDRLQNPGSGEPLLYRSTYKRRHSLITDGLRYVGPVGIRWEAVFQPRRTIYLDDFQSARKPMLTGTLGLSYEGFGGDLNIITEGFYQRTFDIDSGETSFVDRDFWGVALGAELGFGLFSDAGSRWEDLRMRVGGVYFGADSDLSVYFETSFQLLDPLTLSGGFQIVEELNGDSDSIGGWLDSTDQFYLRLSYAF